jgi:acyl dehydratase
VGVAARDEVTAFAEFVDRHDLGHVPHVADTDGSVWARFGITGQPAWIFIDGETAQRQVLFGALGGERLHGLLTDLSS